MGAVATTEKKWNGMNWIRQEKRLAIYMRDGFTCVYCGSDLRNCEPGGISLDHIHPRSLGGGNEATNLVTACGLCNSARGNKSVEEYAPGGALERIARLIVQPLNVKLSKAILRGEAGNPALEALR